MLLPVEAEDKTISRFLLGAAISVVILAVGAWASDTSTNIDKLWEHIESNRAAVQSLHEDQALNHQELKYIESQLDEIKELIKHGPTR